MKATEMSLLLNAIALGDNRRLGDTEDEQRVIIAWWLDKIGDLDYAGALQAVRDHQRESTEYLTAAHIRQRVKDNRELALGRAAFRLRNLRPPEELDDDPVAQRRWIDARLAEAAGIAPAPEPRRELGAGR